MKAHVLIGFLLACTAAAHPLTDDGFDDDFDDLEAMNNGIFNIRERFMLSDEGNLVLLDLENDDDNDDETEEETKKDLKNRVFFYLHTRQGGNLAQPLFIDESASLDASYFDPKKPTKIVTHGWINSRKSDACVLVRNAYLAHGDYNVIVIDWSKISFRPYIWASKRVLMVGQYVAKMLDFLEEHGMDLSQTTIVGHSLGAHVSGLAAHYAKGTVNYVVGLDPALPNFHLAGPGFRISTGDANHVEIIHTNAGLLGFMTPIGDIDFYPNGGYKQRGCGIVGWEACSHARSYRFFAESINTPVGFHANFCKDYRRFKLGLCKSEPTTKMGGYKKALNIRGTFFLHTKGKFPFALGN